MENKMQKCKENKDVGGWWGRKEDRLQIEGLVELEGMLRKKDRDKDKRQILKNTA